MDDEELRRRGRALTPEQKRRVLDRIGEVWLKVPMLRLGQMLSLAIKSADDLFVTEDDALVERVEEAVSDACERWQAMEVSDG